MGVRSLDLERFSSFLRSGDSTEKSMGIDASVYADEHELSEQLKRRNREVRSEYDALRERGGRGNADSLQG